MLFTQNNKALVKSIIWDNHRKSHSLTTKLIQPCTATAHTLDQTNRWKNISCNETYGTLSHYSTQIGMERRASCYFNASSIQAVTHSLAVSCSNCELPKSPQSTLFSSKNLICEWDSIICYVIFRIKKVL